MIAVAHDSKRVPTAALTRRDNLPPCRRQPSSFRPSMAANSASKQVVTRPARRYSSTTDPRARAFCTDRGSKMPSSAVSISSAMTDRATAARQRNRGVPSRTARTTCGLSLSSSTSSGCRFGESLAEDRTRLLARRFYPISFPPLRRSRRLRLMALRASTSSVEWERTTPTTSSSTSPIEQRRGKNRERTDKTRSKSHLSSSLCHSPRFCRQKTWPSRRTSSPSSWQTR